MAFLVFALLLSGFLWFLCFLFVGMVCALCLCTMDDGDGGNGNGDWWHGGNNDGGDAFDDVLIVNLVEVKFKFL